MVFLLINKKKYISSFTHFGSLVLLFITNVYNAFCVFRAMNLCDWFKIREDGENDDDGAWPRYHARVLNHLNHRVVD